MQRFLVYTAMGLVMYGVADRAQAQAVPSQHEASASAHASHAGPSDRLTLSLLDEPGADTAPASAAREASDDPFREGARVLSFYGSGTWGSRGDLYMGHLAAAYYFLDHLAIEAEVYGGGVLTDQAVPADDHGLYGFALRLRYHMIVEDDWSLYADLGAGTQWHDEPFPYNGTHQNFSPQLGLGLTWDIHRDWRLILGGRWHHISNASREGDLANPGYDGGMAYLGLQTGF